MDRGKEPAMNDFLTGFKAVWHVATLAAIAAVAILGAVFLAAFIHTVVG